MSFLEDDDFVANIEADIRDYVSEYQSENVNRLLFGYLIEINSIIDTEMQRSYSSASFHVRARSYGGVKWPFKL